MENADKNPTEKCCTFEMTLGKRIKLGPVGLGPFHVKLNPIVTIVSVIIIWGFVAVAMAVPNKSFTELSKWKAWVTDSWTWLYVGTQDVWFIFIAYIFFSKYSKLKLGSEDEKPEWSDATYFTMLFAAGIGIGLFFFGVAEPIFHYRPGLWGNRFYHRYTDNVQAQDAINLTFFHWGIHGWVVYVLVGLLLGFIAYRNGLPMTMRTCFYPLIGDRVYGRIGDIIDILSVVSTMFGVCTSLGLGAIQLNQGIHRIFGIKMSLDTQIVLIWIITAIATTSVISGMSVGIRRLSEICFSVGMLILLIVFFADDTWYTLNIFTQSIGYYIQWVVQLGFHTDSFAQMDISSDGKENPTWMDDWTMFYWGWWISWSPFVGMFIARISKGRTIREFITYTMTVPIIYTFFWFSVFGGIGIKMEREAIAAGIECTSLLGGKNSTESFQGLYRLSCRDSTNMWFDVMQQYEGIGMFMCFISLIGIVLYFVTSSDSGSLIIDCLSANGEQEPPIPQRIFWALTEGACATALLYSGGSAGLKALQSVSICAGLFYTMILNFMCVALWRSMREATGEYDPYGPKFSTQLIDPLHKVPTRAEAIQLLLAVVAPFWGGSYASQKSYGSKSRIPSMVAMAICFVGWIILMLLSAWLYNIAYIAWAVLCGLFVYLTGIRANIREQHRIVGNMFEDFFACMLAYPLAVVQMENHMRDFDPEKKRDPERNTARNGRDTFPMENIHANPGFVINETPPPPKQFLPDTRPATAVVHM